VITVLDVLLLAWLALIACFALFSAYGGLGPLRRVIRERTRPVHELAPGVAEVVGRLRVSEPLTALDGTPAVVARLQVGYSYTNTSGKGYQDPWAVDWVDRAAHAELSDGTGACVVELDRFLVLGRVTREVWSARDCEQRHPELWADLSARAHRSIDEIRVTQTYVPADPDAEVFVSGEVVVDESVEPGADYRSTKQRHRFVGTDVRPLLLSSWSEREVRGHLLRPSLRLAALALVTIAVGVGFWLGHETIRRALLAG